MKKTLLFAFIPLVFACTGFKLPSHRGPEDFDHKTINLFKKGYGDGIITAFLGDPSMRGTIKQASYWLLEEEVFKGKYFVGNYYEEEKEFILFCLLDYRQVEFRFNHKKSFKHRLSLKKGEESVCPVDLGRLTKGAHDIIIALADISNTRSEIALKHSIQTHRANIFVESTDFPALTFTPLLQHAANSESSVFQLRFQEEEKPFLKRVHLKLNNDSGKNLESIVLLFDHYEQLRERGVYFSLDNDHEVDIAFNLGKDPELMFCLKINNPYTIIEPKPAVLSTQNRSIELSNFLIAGEISK